MIKFRCAACKQKIAVPDDFAGHKVKCPKCAAPIDLPALATIGTAEGGGSSDRAADPPATEGTPSALAQMAAEALNDPVEVPLGETAPPDIEEQAQRRPRRDSLGAGRPIARPQEPVSDADALAAAAAAATDSPPAASQAAVPRAAKSAPKPQPEAYVAPVPQPVTHDPLRHTHRTRMRIPGYWFLLICGWLCAVGAAMLFIAAVGLAILNVSTVMNISDPIAAAGARAAALASFGTLMALAFATAMLSAISLIVRRTAINTWLLRHHFMGH